MIEAFFFDFNQTLVSCPPWMELEVVTFPHAALTSLADQDLIAPPGPAELERASRLFRSRRRSANRSGRESTHLQDLQAILRSLGYSSMVPLTMLETTIESLHRGCLPHARLIAGARQALEGLRSAGYCLGIISNAAFSPFLNWTLEAFDLADLFDQSIVSADVGIRKPRREIFDLALGGLGVNAGQAVQVGDDYQKDIQAAKRAGLRAIWLSPGGEQVPGQNRPTPDAVFATLEPIVEWAASQS